MARDSEDPLGVLGHPSCDLWQCAVQIEVRGKCLVCDLRPSPPCLVGEVDVPHSLRSESYELADRLRPLHQELAGALSHRPLSEGRHLGDSLGVRVRYRCRDGHSPFSPTLLSGGEGRASTGAEPVPLAETGVPLGGARRPSGSS